VHQYVRNMSEYMNYNSSANYRDNFAAAGKPEGITWAGLVMVKNNRNQQYNGARAGWAIHPEKEITAFYPENTSAGGWSPPPAPLVVLKMVNYPEHNGETMKMTSFHTYGGGVEFGFQDHQQMFVGYRWSATYQVAVDRDTGLYSGTINPFTGRPVIGAFPGMLLPSDERFSQWIWGGDRNWQGYTCWGELHDVAPRDSFELDLAIMFTPVGVSDWVTPDLVEANMDDPMMQDLLAPAESWSEIADVVVNGGFQVPVAPTTPPLTIIPGDRQVSLTWSDLPLQTPDPFYYFLQDNPGLDPGGAYREYDFEGFRLYRSFVGPNDSHSELLADYSIGANTLQFHYIDKREDDEPYRRMRNGQKVWYALVAYDSNVDPATGSGFSLPDPAGGKLWNRPGEQIYQVIPRSEASEFRSAEFLSVSYTGSATTPVSSIELAGDGTGNLTEAPKWLTPAVGEVTLNTVNNEKIKSDKTVSITTADWWHDGGGCWGGNRPYARRIMKLVDGSNESVAPVQLKGNTGGGQLVSFFDPPQSDGVSFGLDMTFEGTKYPGTYRNAWVHNIDVGSYAGSVETWSATGCSRNDIAAPNQNSITRNGRFTITWKTAASGGMTVEVQDLTRGTSVANVAYQDEIGWGIVTTEGYGDVGGRRVWGTYYQETFMDAVPKADRTALMLSEIPADYSELFAIWLNGQLFWVMDGMPADGTVMTIDNAWGSWNADQTVFTQVADMPWFDDKWEVKIQAMTQDMEDADLSRIKVVPNPYMATSFLDLSPANRRVEFVNLPSGCTIRIYTLSGNLVNVLNHIGINRNGWGNYTDLDRLQAGTGAPTEFTGYDNHTGTEPWNLRNRFGQIVASGLYLYHVTDQRGETFTGKFYVVN